MQSPYGVRQDEQRVDKEQVAEMAREHRPKLIVVGWSAYPRRMDFAQFAGSPMRSAHRCWSTWRISPGWLPPGFTRTRCRLPTS